ncbi:MAG: uridine phosphorylase [Candidatus Brocadia sp. AMX2]|uniref:Uridine phosphorylase n=1 Tax=Candidatus Brocadia sinica JPN1 TaxID=1197129 RepID=A0ABQ0JV22_9BACT|nr:MULTISPECIES: uridine phosphorylase [Brocadia]KXK32823.1 MAG: uridine phosphorylase [Candidatus Brocadia sinica]MBC6930921.1 uridine phosphorylase [Candidatus Brocadia sp.]MBL1167911.1 uridine phosphorylase [Candidatus Brocadia sp. AMX1]NOG41529.1 uridine phosphorylase [Planctomycetota bacterium]KAA0245368.1 MAG: uridine phosphorylase [Candidatus Brocadia sp. AMX2]
MNSVYHLDLDSEKIQGAKIALLPGDPFRSQVIAETISGIYGTYNRKLAWKREFCTYLAEIKGKRLLITSTGIGGPSASIAIDELAQLGIDTFIRVGTTGAIQEHINIGDVIITSGSVRLDGASTHYAPIEYPAVAHYEILNALVEGAKKATVRYHVGVTASSDTFYPGEERYDSFSKYVLRRFQGATKEWQRLHVLNYEMESSTILTLTASLGLRGGCITGVVNEGGTGKITKESLKAGEENVIKVAIAAVECLI